MLPEDLNVTIFYICYTLLLPAITSLSLQSYLEYWCLLVDSQEERKKKPDLNMKIKNAIYFESLQDYANQLTKGGGEQTQKQENKTKKPPPFEKPKKHVCL